MNCSKNKIDLKKLKIDKIPSFRLRLSQLSIIAIFKKGVMCDFRNYDDTLMVLEEIENLGDLKRFIDGYDIGIKYADELVGKLVSILKDFGVYDDTLIMISSDHGESLGELNVYGDHSTADHIINRVPMIIKWPGKQWNKEYNSLIYTTDVAATIIEGVERKVPNSWDGKSFYKEIENGEEFGRDRAQRRRGARIGAREPRPPATHPPGAGGRGHLCPGCRRCRHPPGKSPR